MGAVARQAAAKPRFPVTSAASPQLSSALRLSAGPSWADRRRWRHHGALCFTPEPSVVHSSVSSVSAGLLAARLAPFARLFTRPTWGRVPVLVEGALLTVHRRTVSAALRAAGQEKTPGFARYHRVLNQARWSARAMAGGAARAAGRHLRAVRPRRDRRGRHVGAALGQAHRRPRHLPRRGALQPRAFREGQRPALGVAVPVGADTVGRARLGAAVPDRAGAFGAVRTGARQGAQEAHGLGQAGPAPDRALDAWTPHCRRGRQRLRRAGPARGRAAAGVRRRPAAHRRPPVRPGAAPHARHDRTASRRRPAPARVGPVLDGTPTGTPTRRGSNTRSQET